MKRDVVVYYSNNYFDAILTDPPHYDLESGLTVSSPCPISTEMKARLRAKESASLASSIYIISRKIERQSIGLYQKVRRELREYFDKKLERLWQEGISGADFFLAAIGAGIEVFWKKDVSHRERKRD